MNETIETICLKHLAKPEINIKIEGCGD